MCTRSPASHLRLIQPKTVNGIPKFVSHTILVFCLTILDESFTHSLIRLSFISLAIGLDQRIETDIASSVQAEFLVLPPPLFSIEIGVRAEVAIEVLLQAS